MARKNTLSAFPAEVYPWEDVMLGATVDICDNEEKAKIKTGSQLKA